MTNPDYDAALYATWDRIYAALLDTLATTDTTVLRFLAENARTESLVRDVADVVLQGREESPP